MAKKVVAGLKKSKEYAKIIKTVKSPKTGAYSFKEEMVPVDMVNQTLNSDK